MFEERERERGGEIRGSLACVFDWVTFVGRSELCCIEPHTLSSVASSCVNCGSGSFRVSRHRPSDVWRGPFNLHRARIFQCLAVWCRSPRVRPAQNASRRVFPHAELNTRLPRTVERWRRHGMPICTLHTSHAAALTYAPGFTGGSVGPQLVPVSNATSSLPTNSLAHSHTHTLCLDVFSCYASELFLAGDIGGCHSHPQQEKACPPRYGEEDLGEDGQECGGADGYYPCCKKTADRYTVECTP